MRMIENAAHAALTPRTVHARAAVLRARLMAKQDLSHKNWPRSAVPNRTATVPRPRKPATASNLKFQFHVVLCCFEAVLIHLMRFSTTFCGFTEVAWVCTALCGFAVSHGLLSLSVLAAAGLLSSLCHVQNSGRYSTFFSVLATSTLFG